MRTLATLLLLLAAVGCSKAEPAPDVPEGATVIYSAEEHGDLEQFKVPGTENEYELPGGTRARITVKP